MPATIQQPCKLLVGNEVPGDNALLRGGKTAMFTRTIARAAGSVPRRGIGESSYRRPRLRLGQRALDPGNFKCPNDDCYCEDQLLVNDLVTVVGAVGSGARLAHPQDLRARQL